MSKESFIRKFDELFKTNFHKMDIDQFNNLVNSKKVEFGLKDLNPNNFLLILSYLYLESRSFSINGENKFDKINENIEKDLGNLFKKSLICIPPKKDFILIVTKKAKGNNPDLENLFKNVKSYNGSDILYLNKREKIITFTKGDAYKKIKKIVSERKISFIPPKPKEIGFDPIEKILTSKKIDIFEIEFRSVNLEKIRGLYLKAGSKEEKINSKIKKIQNILLDKKILRVSNIKKIHLSLKDAGRDRSASLVVTSPKKLGIYKIKWRGSPPSELDNFIKTTILKDLLNVELVDKEVPIYERILESYLGKYLSPTELLVNKTKFESWDKYKLLTYQKDKLKPNYINFESLINVNLKKDYIISNAKIKLSKSLIKKGFLLKRKKDSKELFMFLNKRGLKDDVRKMLNKKLPVVIIDFYENCIEEKNRYNFLMINEKGLNDFINVINDICSYPKFYENQYNNFINSKNQLQNIENTLNQIRDNQEKGAKWEEVCFDIFNLIFHKTFSLSGPSLPDGITFWTDNKAGFLWDSKALFNKNLKNSIQNKNKKPKDIAYIEVFRKRLKISYYIFLTCGVDEVNFNNAKQILEKYNKNVCFCCLTNNAILDLSKFFEDQDKSSIFHRNLNKFCDNLKSVLSKGYINNIKFDDISKGIEEEASINKKELRKEIKMEQDK